MGVLWDFIKGFQGIDIDEELSEKEIEELETIETKGEENKKSKEGIVKKVKTPTAFRTGESISKEDKEEEISK